MDQDFPNNVQNDVLKNLTILKVEFGRNLQMWNMWYGFSTYLSSDNSHQSTELFEANIEEDSND